MNATSILKKSGLALLLCIFSTSTSAQSLSETQVPIIIPSYFNRTLSSGDQLLKLRIQSNVDYTYTSSATWLKLTKEKNGLSISAKPNYTSENRTAKVTLADANGKTTQIVIFTQESGSLLDKVEDSGVQVKVSSATDNTHQGSSTLAKSIDGDLSTIYHSNWNNDVWPDNPAELVYTFTNVSQIDYINYIPRSSGTNGNFGELEIWYKTSGNSEYTKLGDYDFGMSSSPTSVRIPGGLKNPTAIKFLVKTGGGDTKTETVSGQAITKYFASCAEMQFCYYKNETASDYDIFTDNMYTALKPEVTQDDIDALTEPLAISLATQLYGGEYNTDYRLHEYKCVLDPTTLGEQLHIGDGYTRYQNPTGLVFNTGRSIIIARDIPDSVTASLIVKKWYDPDNEGQSRESFILHNGINVINRTSSWTGLGYISYFSDTPENFGKIKIHVVNGIVNGYYDLATMSNAQFDEVLAAAQYPIMDLIGKHAQAVFPVADLQKYAGGKGRWLTAVYDSIVCWEQQFDGFEKYNKMPENRIMARVNYSYYMFRDADGVAFKYDTMNRVCSPEKLTSSDEDACWGLSHEWGHVHQLRPYFMWGGLCETSNNMNSCYNTQKMGYTNRLSSYFTTINTNMLKDGQAQKASTQRHAAYVNASKSTNSELCLAMADSTITKVADDPDHALSYLEVDVFQRLCPFWKLQCYMDQVAGDKDYWPDLYEMLRNTETDTDEYSIAATNQKKVSSNANVVPFQLNFIRKASIRAGVNLYPYFEDYGFFRTIALYYNDYGNYFYLLDKDTRDKFKAHMESLVADGTLKAMSDEMRETMENITQNLKKGPDWSSFKN